MAVTITCYGGVGEIGGNKILLESGEDRVLFDFGKAYGRYGDFFDGIFIKERTARGLLDPVSLELVPPLRGLLREDLTPVFDSTRLNITKIPLTGKQKKERVLVELPPEEKESFWQHWEQRWQKRRGYFRDLRRVNGLPVDIVLLSHAHQDHIGDVQYVAPEIPACSTRMTAFISKVLLDVGSPGHSGAPFTNPSKVSEEGMLQADSDQAYIARPWHFLDGDLGACTGEDPLEDDGSFWASPPCKKGKGTTACTQPASAILSRIRHWTVDHSLFGAASFAVGTDLGWVAYTGDLRFPEQPENMVEVPFVRDLAACSPLVLLCEGTRLTHQNSTTESEVHSRCQEVVKKAQGRFVVADFGPRNVKRLLTFRQIAVDTGRCLLVQPKDAYLLRVMYLANPTMMEAAGFTRDMLHQDEELHHIGVYADPKAKTLGWENNVRDRFAASFVSPQEVKNDPGHYILASSLTDAADLLDLQYLLGGQSAGIYIFSNSAAYDEEQKVDLIRLWNWTRHLNLELVGLRPNRYGRGRKVLELEPEPGYHASGHASGQDLLDFVLAVRPKILIPIHTENPHWWQARLKGTGIKVRLPQMGNPLDIR